VGAEWGRLMHVASEVGAGMLMIIVIETFLMEFVILQISISMKVSWQKQILEIPTAGPEMATCGGNLAGALRSAGAKGERGERDPNRYNQTGKRKLTKHETRLKRSAARRVLSSEY
jgi:hypothetical protein